MLADFGRQSEPVDAAEYNGTYQKKMISMRNDVLRLCESGKDEKLPKMAPLLTQTKTQKLTFEKECEMLVSAQENLFGSIATYVIELKLQVATVVWGLTYATIVNDWTTKGRADSWYEMHKQQQHEQPHGQSEESCCY